MLTEVDLLPEPNHAFWNMAKGSILYVGLKMPGPLPKVCRGKVVQVLHRKTGGENYGPQNVIFLRRR